MLDRIIYATIGGIVAWEVYRRGYHHHHLLMRVFTICQFAVVVTGCLRGAPWQHIVINIALPIVCWALFYAYDAELKKISVVTSAPAPAPTSTKRKR